MESSIRRAPVVQDALCRYRLWRKGDTRWRSRLPRDRVFREGCAWFNDLPVRPADTVVDVGANEGGFLFPALRYFTPRRAIAVEMLPDLAERLRQRSPAHVDIINCALGAAPGRQQILRSRFSPASSLLPMLPASAEFSKFDVRQETSGWCDVTTLDAVCDSARLDHVGFLKIDVQGYDLEVLRGATETLRRTAQILIEIEWTPYYGGAPSFAAILDFLQQAGFALCGFHSPANSGAGRLLHNDAFFIAERLL